MAIARRHLIREGLISSYHVISRCVRRAWLCGEDPETGNSYDHRKLWIKNRLRYLSEYFSIEIAAYSVMSNHWHGVLRTRPDLAQTWSPKEIATRWWYLFPKRKDRLGNAMEPKEDDLDQILFDPKTGDALGRLELLRTRLASISWFMRCLNESIARRSNAEDKCKGRFWEGRFKSVELLDQAAILACMAYVDLNPVHAGIAQTPESSDYTSGQDRAKTKIAKEAWVCSRERYKNKKQDRELNQAIKRLEDQVTGDSWLAPLKSWPIDQPQQRMGSIVNMDQESYLEILDWTGRQHRLDKKGSIPQELKPILERLDIEVEQWLKTVKSFDALFYRVAGKVKSILEATQERGRKWLAGKKASKTAFG